METMKLFFSLFCLHISKFKIIRIYGFQILWDFSVRILCDFLYDLLTSKKYIYIDDNQLNNKVMLRINTITNDYIKLTIRILSIMSFLSLSKTIII